ncbi:MAG: hypothetical protein LLF92_09490 [Planctomycetaceae bacterium]|nr:hypothetical protein [Planctomycetaceae bacterium]
MISKRTLGIWAVLTIGVVASAFGKDEQWLSYRSSRQARDIVQGVCSQNLELASEKPEGVELPVFKSDQPLFGKFKTPMAKDGFLWVAFDRTSKRGAYSILYIDSNANKSLKDETAVTAYQKEQNYAQFGSIAVIFDSNDGPITYHLNIYCYSNEKENRAYVSSGCWYEGQITVDGTKYECMLVDYDSDGTFNDKSLNQWKSDRLQIKKGEKWESAFVGKYISIDDKLYTLKVAKDGAYIKIAKAVDVNYGNFRVPSEIAELQAGGKNGSFVFHPKNGICKIPAGHYQILNWSVEEKKGGDIWQLRASGSSDKARFFATEANEPNLMIGQPVVSKLDVQPDGKNHRINHRLEGRLGESVDILHNGSRTNAPKVSITNADKTYNKTFSLEYG